MPEQQGVMSTYQLTAHNHSGVGQGGLVDPTVINHDALLNFVGAEHLSLPNTLVNVLSDHNKIAHDALGIELLGDHVYINERLTIERLAGEIPSIVFIEGGINRTLIEYDPLNHETVIESLSENADVTLRPDGTGKARFGVHAGIGAETVTGYINIKDGAGNARKLAVVS